MSETGQITIVDAIADGIIRVAADGVVTMFSPACENMFGYTAAEVVGADVDRLIAAPRLDEHDHRFVMGEMIGVGREVLGRRPNGDTFPIDLSVGEGSEGGEVFFVGVLRDATERKRAEARREKLVEDLTHFTQVASHELSEPLRMVTAFCELLSKDYGDRLDDRGREYMSLAISATTQMRDLLCDLTDSGELAAEREPNSWFEAGDVFDRTLESLQRIIRESGAQVARDDLPRLYGNPIRFTRLIRNLISNAIKYGAPGVAPLIHVTAAREGEFWRFSVADNGIGIDARHYERIFEPFKRLHDKSRYQGAGLGLSICRTIVDGFGGRIWVDSTPGAGSIFSFTVKSHGEEDGDGGADG